MRRRPRSHTASRPSEDQGGEDDARASLFTSYRLCRAVVRNPRCVGASAVFISMVRFQWRRGELLVCDVGTAQSHDCRHSGNVCREPKLPTRRHGPHQGDREPLRRIPKRATERHSARKQLRSAPHPGLRRCPQRRRTGRRDRPIQSWRHVRYRSGRAAGLCASAQVV
jgi:hypothetical protein